MEMAQLITKNLQLCSVAMALKDHKQLSPREAIHLNLADKLQLEDLRLMQTS